MFPQLSSSRLGPLLPGKLLVLWSAALVALPVLMLAAIALGADARDGAQASTLSHLIGTVLGRYLLNTLALVGL